MVKQDLFFFFCTNTCSPYTKCKSYLSFSSLEGKLSLLLILFILTRFHVHRKKYKNTSDSNAFHQASVFLVFGFRRDSMGILCGSRLGSTRLSFSM